MIRTGRVYFPSFPTQSCSTIFTCTCLRPYQKNRTDVQYSQAKSEVPESNQSQIYFTKNCTGFAHQGLAFSLSIWTSISRILLTSKISSAAAWQPEKPLICSCTQLSLQAILLLTMTSSSAGKNKKYSAIHSLLPKMGFSFTSVCVSHLQLNHLGF